ncbi:MULTISPECIES: hypothetical protein [Bacillus cereus group]|uniref:Uncharacterized protein n=1 Tax=Bacillus thuringiensis TaxID=1428 RepID=A0A1W6WZU0_BACTU|nr:hypothetical protein [Bacillus thuringiensis]MEC2879374.1 hypothetical protein [Bacillus cereus]AEA19630.1 hypothetical protein CT43_P51014 [Bacillus thuringiensis serovar chinensis CT-43]ARP61733.1 hypothetical protein CAB88_32530 [Bacillus thuringiensis]AST05379.1 hypothetical protein BT10792_33765 [Bacillus thuringiensis]MBG9620183.1 hypothetical protein [Bacillus thuringiensis]
MIMQKNLYDPIMYLMKGLIDRQIYNGGKPMPGNDPNDVFKESMTEGYTLIRDGARLSAVDGDKYLHYDLAFNSQGMLEKVLISHKVTGKEMEIQLIYNAQKQLERVQPRLLNKGNGILSDLPIPDVS